MLGFLSVCTASREQTATGAVRPFRFEHFLEPTRDARAHLRIFGFLWRRKQEANASQVQQQPTSFRLHFNGVITLNLSNACLKA